MSEEIARVLLPLPVEPVTLLVEVIDRALAQLDPRLTSDRARMWLLAFAVQETDLQTRHQYRGGPGRSFWQFEEGTPKTRAGCTGVLMHERTAEPMKAVCLTHGVRPTPRALYQALEHDDLLAAKAARFLLFADAPLLPGLDDRLGGWRCYIRTWNPGRRRPEKWPRSHAIAYQALLAAGGSSAS